MLATIRWFAFVLCLILPSWGWAEPERMICAIVADHYFELGKELETNIANDDEKTLYISIQDEILAINYEASSARIFRQNHEASSDILGIINRKFVGMSEFAIDVIVVGGKECSFGDKEPRNATWMSTYDDGFLSSVFSCTCN